MAELIIHTQPIYNKRLPDNTLYVSSNQARVGYDISLKKFKLIAKETDLQYIFKNKLYIDLDFFQKSISKYKPNHHNLPKLNNSIGLLFSPDYRFDNCVLCNISKIINETTFEVICNNNKIILQAKDLDKTWITKSHHFVNEHNKQLLENS